MNWLVFDRNYALIPQKSGFKRITTAAHDTDGNGSHERIFSPQITIDQPGYMYIYISNEEETQLEVFFDDFKVDHIKSPVVQMDDYYPFGLTFNSYSRENSTPNMYQYNGKEKQDELGFDWLDYGARNYMADIGRWGVVDPLGEKMKMHSPYNYAFNNPIRFIDKHGEAPEPFHYNFFMEIAVPMYNAAKAKGMSSSGAVFMIAQASIESGWGNKASREINNFFGIMGGRSKYKTEHGSLQSFASLDEGINGYFDNMNSRWPGAIELMKGDNFSGDAINKALNTGDYQKYPAYFVPLEGQSKDYGGKISNQMRSVAARMVAALDFAIGNNETKLEETRSSISGKFDDLKSALQNGESTDKILKDINKTLDQYHQQNSANENLKSIRKEVNGYLGGL